MKNILKWVGMWAVFLIVISTVTIWLGVEAAFVGFMTTMFIQYHRHLEKYHGE